jgi:hypothetical protein
MVYTLTKNGRSSWQLQNVCGAGTIGNEELCLVPAPQKKPAACLLPAFAGFLLDLHFGPEDGGDMFSKMSGSF